MAVPLVVSGIENLTWESSSTLPGQIKVMARLGSGSCAPQRVPKSVSTYHLEHRLDPLKAAEFLRPRAEREGVENTSVATTGTRRPFRLLRDPTRRGRMSFKGQVGIVLATLIQATNQVRSNPSTSPIHPVAELLRLSWFVRN